MPNSGYTFSSDYFFGKAGPEEFFNPTSGPTERTGGDPTIEDFLHQQYEEKFRVADGSNWADVAIGFGDFIAGEIDRALWGPNTDTRIQMGMIETSGTGQKVPFWMEVSATLDDNREAVWSFVGALLTGSSYGIGGQSAKVTGEALELSGISVTADDLWVDRQREDREYFSETDDFTTLDGLIDNLPVETSLDDIEADETIDDQLDEEELIDYDLVDPEDEDVEEDYEDDEPDDFVFDFDEEIDALFELLDDLNVDEDPNNDLLSLVDDNYLGPNNFDLLIDQPGFVDPFEIDMAFFTEYGEENDYELSFSTGVSGFSFG